MYNKKEHAYINAIKKILREEWDPIGIKDFPEAFDEYDMYASDICNFVLSKKSQNLLTDFLWDIEVLNMGLEGNKEEDERISKLIMNNVFYSKS